jgi:hypothetical protein
MVDEVEAFRAAAMELMSLTPEARAAAFANLIERLYPAHSAAEGATRSGEMDGLVVRLGAALGLMAPPDEPIG